MSDVKQSDTTIRDAGLTGMVTLRGDLDDATLRAAIKSVTGTDMPGRGEITAQGEHTVAWMSPDEVLILLPYADAAAVVAALSDALREQHHLAVNVSDARAHFVINGPEWRDVVARLSPMDLRGFGPGQIRRTRFAQVPAAVWPGGKDSAHVICFRSVATYMQDLLQGAAQSGPLSSER